MIVNLSCKLCARRGRYRLARLAARYGPEQSLDGLLADLAHDCPYWRSKPRRYDPRCGARFEDLDRLRPQDVPLIDGAPRQRAPSREDVPQRRSTATGTAGKPPMLSDWTSPAIVVACAKCGRDERFDTKAIKAATVGDVRLVDLRRSLTADCPCVQNHDFSNWCGATLKEG
ncbi:MAG: hypothetical protein ACRYGP_28930 [Janthinobacterium lividum]